MTLIPRQPTRSAATFEALLPDALAAMARSLRAGSTLSVAAGEAARNVGEPMAGSLEQLGLGLASGKPLVQLLDAWTAAHPSTDSRLAAAVLSIGHVAGSGHARALDGLAESLRLREQHRREVHTASAQVRLSMLFLIAAPVLFLAAVATIEPGAVGWLLIDPVGRVALASGILLDLGAWITVRVLIDRSVARC